MKHIIFDCDNTFGVAGCDVDDGLALLYLLGCKEADLLGVTTTYGNSEESVVYQNTLRMLYEIGRNDIVVKKGGPKRGAYESEAADYLVEMAERYKGDLVILATGSLTNLQGAYEKDNHFFEAVSEIVLMGGITEPLLFEKRRMEELNFSCDPKAAKTVLTEGKKVSVITGNNCLKVLFTKGEYREVLFRSEKEIARYIRKETDYWFGYNEKKYGINGFYNWDVTAAVYLMHPELFEDHRYILRVSEVDLETGYLRRAESGNSICNLPTIAAEEKFKKNIYDMWLNDITIV